ncbi:MAG: peroxiredoxin [Gammaproteobacteria bacterium]
MKKVLISLFCSFVLALPAIAALQEGDAAPDFTLRASLCGEEFNFSLADALAEGPVVVYFFPSAFTRGCNIQAHEFAENMESFEAAGASVIGVSLDSIERLNAFASDPAYCAGKLPVASDTSGEIAQSFDLNVRPERDGAVDTRGVAIDHGFAERVTFIVLQDGTIAQTIGELTPAENVLSSLEAVQSLAH